MCGKVPQIVGITREDVVTTKPSRFDNDRVENIRCPGTATKLSGSARQILRDRLGAATAKDSSKPSLPTSTSPRLSRHHGWDGRNVAVSGQST
jgi:hypothetical protein